MTILCCWAFQHPTNGPDASGWSGTGPSRGSSTYGAAANGPTCANSVRLIIPFRQNLEGNPIVRHVVKKPHPATIVHHPDRTLRLRRTRRPRSAEIQPLRDLILDRDLIPLIIPFRQNLEGNPIVRHVVKKPHPATIVERPTEQPIRDSPPGPHPPSPSDPSSTLCRDSTPS
jgi:hypothetical protein